MTWYYCKPRNVVFTFADNFCILWLFSAGSEQNMAGRKKNYSAPSFCMNLCLLLIIFNNRILSLSSCRSGNYVAIDNGEQVTMERDDGQLEAQVNIFQIKVHTLISYIGPIIIPETEESNVYERWKSLSLSLTQCAVSSPSDCSGCVRPMCSVCPV